MDGFKATALRHRPQVFADLVGQDHVATTIGNAITARRIAHAYLFSGPRGVGKTSVARILAKALNCEHGPTPTPCGQCPNCTEIAGGQSLDVYEIDGASNRGIDQIRELRDSVRFTPAKSRYKIYIIDEVHMLTNEAFNALLKTLEEPPAHVVFIFATTEAAKVKITIRSRCQHYRFKRIPASLVAAHLGAICAAQGVSATPEALFLVARAGDGSMRDAQSLLDQVIAYSGGSFDEAHVREISGILDATAYFDFLACVLYRDAAALVRQLAALEDNGVDLGGFAYGLAELLRNLVLVMDGATAEELEMTGEDHERLVGFAQGDGAVTADEAALLLTLLVELGRELASAPNPRRVFEFHVFKLIAFRDLVRPEELLARIEALRAELSGGAPAPPRPAARPFAERPAPPRPAAPAPPRPPAPVQPAPAPAAVRPPVDPRPAGPVLSPAPVLPPSPAALPRVVDSPETDHPAARSAESIVQSAAEPAAMPPPVEPAVPAVAPVTAAPAAPAGDAHALYDALMQYEERANQIVAAVLREAHRVELEAGGARLVAYYDPKHRFHKEQAGEAHREHIMAFLAEHTGRSVDFETRTEAGSARPVTAPAAADAGPDAAYAAEAPVPPAPAQPAPAQPVPRPAATAPAASAVPAHTAAASAGSPPAPVQPAPRPHPQPMAWTPGATAQTGDPAASPAAAPAAAPAAGAAHPPIVDSIVKTFRGTVVEETPAEVDTGYDDGPGLFDDNEEDEDA